jgi:hypothetical protein
MRRFTTIIIIIIIIIIINKRKKSDIEKRKMTNQIRRIRDKIIDHEKVSFVWTTITTSISATTKIKMILKINEIRIKNFDYL